MDGTASSAEGQHLVQDNIQTLDEQLALQENNRLYEEQLHLIKAHLIEVSKLRNDMKGSNPSFHAANERSEKENIAPNDNVDAKAGKIIEVFFSKDWDFFVSVSPSAALQITDGAATRTPSILPEKFFWNSPTILQGKKLSEGNGICINLDSADTLMFNTLMNSSQICLLVGKMGQESRDKFQIVAIPERHFKKNNILEALCLFRKLRLIRLVSEVPSTNIGKECLGPQASRVEDVEFYTSQSGDHPIKSLRKKLIDCSS
jgi:hypothetical protein